LLRGSHHFYAPDLQHPRAHEPLCRAGGCLGDHRASFALPFISALAMGHSVDSWMSGLLNPPARELHSTQGDASRIAAQC